MDPILNEVNLFPQEEGATFGEYRTTTSINGVQSQFTPSVDPTPTSIDQIGGYQIASEEIPFGGDIFQTQNTETSPSYDVLQATSENGGEGSTFGEYRTTTKINGVDSIFTPDINSKNYNTDLLTTNQGFNVGEIVNDGNLTTSVPLIDTNSLLQNIDNSTYTTYQTNVNSTDSNQVIDIDIDSIIGADGLTSSEPINYTTTNTETFPVIDTNTYQTTYTDTDLGLNLLNTESVNTNDIPISTTTTTEIIETPPIRLPTTSVVDTGFGLDTGTNFGEYQTTTSIGGVQSTLTPSVEPFQTLPQPISITEQKPIQVNAPTTKQIVVPKIQKVYVPTKKTIYVKRPPAAVSPSTIVNTNLIPSPTPAPVLPVVQKQVLPRTLSAPSMPIMQTPVYSKVSVPTAIPAAPRAVQTAQVYSTLSVPSSIPVATKPVYSTGSLPLPTKPLYSTLSIQSQPTVPIVQRPINPTISVIPSVPIQPTRVYSNVPVAPAVAVQPRPVYSTLSVSPSVPLAPGKVYSTVSVAPTVPVQPRPVYSTLSTTPSVPLAPGKVYSTVSVTPTLPIQPRPVYSNVSVVPSAAAQRVVPILPTQPIATPQIIQNPLVPTPIKTVPQFQMIQQPGAQVPIQPMAAQMPAFGQPFTQAPLATGMNRPATYSVSTYGAKLNRNLPVYRAVTSTRTNMARPGSYGNRTYNARRLRY